MVTHVESSLLQSYAKQELEPIAKEQIETHLAACDKCSARLDHVVSGLTMLSEAEIPEFSALDWRRIEIQVSRRLQERSFIPPNRLWNLLDGLKAGPLVLGTAATLALSLVVWFSTSTQSQLSSDNPIPEKVALAPAQNNVVLAPTRNIMLASGRQFEVRGAGLRAISDSVSDMPVFEFGAGALQVTEIKRSSEPVSPLGLMAVGFKATAHSSEFTLRYWANSVEVEVAEGQIQIHTPKSQSSEVARGEIKRLNLDSIETTKKIVEPSPSTNAAPAVVAEKRVLTRDLTPKPPPKVFAPKVQAQFDIEVIPPKKDQISTLWETAREAYYGSADIARGVEPALRLLELAHPGEGVIRAEYGGALNLLCAAYIASDGLQEATRFCEQALNIEKVAEKRRTLHARLGRLYGGLGQNCQRAVEHFTKALAFGKTSILDEGTVLGRARCALELGDNELAEKDLSQLFSRGPKLVRKKEAEALLESLKRRQNKKLTK